MVGFAHSLPGQPESEWETQSQHSRSVGDAASMRAAKFGLAAFGAAAGGLHDLGKFHPDFLAYIRQQRTKGPDHSSAGAIYARQHFGWLGNIVAHAVAGHHAGLKDDLLKLGGRLDAKARDAQSVFAIAAAEGFAFPTALPSPSFIQISDESGFQFALLIRMLFSALVDADRTATEAFYQGDVGRDFSATPADLADALSAFMARSAAERDRTGDAERPINRLRARVLDHVTAQAGLPQGVFTLTVPTGGGKTLTSLRFALDHARHHKLDRVIVVIPFTSVIEQTAAIYREALAPFEDHILEHHSAFEDDEAAQAEEKREGRSRLQLATETWDAPLVVTTAVQFFETLFAAKTSRCRKLHNIARSVVVLDEAQTIPLHLLRPCMAALKDLQRNYGTSIVLCTATQPALADDPADKDRPAAERHSFAGGFVAPKELAPDLEALFRALDRVSIRHAGVLDDEALADRMEASPQALCIVNSRGHARALFELVKARMSDARHLSTLMLPAHRRQVLDAIKTELRAGRPCRVVSTSLVEAGVDFSFPLVLRAEAGLEQIAQSAGRCNREGKLDGRGELLVFRAAGKEPLPALKDNVEAGREIMRHHTDLIRPAAIRAYFEMLYWRRGAEALDKHGVLACCAGKAGTLDFPFETIARNMRMIDDIMAPIIVPIDDDAQRAVESLRYADKVGRLARVLQSYIVGIPPAARLELLSSGAARAIEQDRFGMQFVALSNLDLYRSDVGLTWDDPTFMNADSLTI